MTKSHREFADPLIRACTSVWSLPVPTTDFDRWVSCSSPHVSTFCWSVPSFQFFGCLNVHWLRVNIKTPEIFSFDCQNVNLEMPKITLGFGSFWRKS
jgi:hypothetical protein